MMTYDVLVIDDEVSLARNIKEYLEFDGLEAHVCSDGETALEAFQCCHVPVVILDIRLPGMDGFSVLEQLRAQDAGVRIIMISAHGNTDTGEAALAAGAYAYLSKPLALSELGRVVARARVEVDLPWPTGH
jgi:DNA-binding response OmpR family regulator